MSITSPPPPLRWTHINNTSSGCRTRAVYGDCKTTCKYRPVIGWRPLGVRLFCLLFVCLVDKQLAICVLRSLRQRSTHCRGLSATRTAAAAAMTVATAVTTGDDAIIGLRRNDVSHNCSSRCLCVSVCVRARCQLLLLVGCNSSPSQTKQSYKSGPSRICYWPKAVDENFIEPMTTTMIRMHPTMIRMHAGPIQNPTIVNIRRSSIRITSGQPTAYD